MAKKKEQSKPVTEADLRFRHLELAKNLAQHMLNEMMAAKLTPRDIPQVLSDLCKFVVLSQAYVSKGDALDVVKAFTDLNTDVTCLMMRIVSDNLGNGLETLEVETKEPHPRYNE